MDYVKLWKTQNIDVQIGQKYFCGEDASLI